MTDHISDKNVPVIRDILKNIITEVFKEAGINTEVKVSKKQAAKLVDAINDIDKPADRSSTSNVSSITHGPKIPAQTQSGYYTSGGRGGGYAGAGW
jgi:hypothetical protein